MKKIIDITDGVIYNSVHAAAKAVGCSNASVNNCCYGSVRTVKGHIFEFFDEYDEKLWLDKPIICIEWGNTYDCAKIAAYEFDIPIYELRSALENKTTAGGYHWRLETYRDRLKKRGI